MDEVTRHRVLIVDDDESLCDLIALWLKASYEVAIAHDGESALASMRRAKPDIAVLDVMMPRMSGIELASKVRNDPDLRATPLLFMSAYHAILEPHEREAIRPWGLLSKPFTREQLLARLQSILGSAREAG